MIYYFLHCRLTGLLPQPKEESAFFPIEDLKCFHGLDQPQEISRAEKILFGYRDDGSEGIFCPRKSAIPNEGDENDPLNA